MYGPSKLTKQCSFAHGTSVNLSHYTEKFKPDQKIVNGCIQGEACYFLHIDDPPSMRQEQLDQFRQKRPAPSKQPTPSKKTKALTEEERTDLELMQYGAQELHNSILCEHLSMNPAMSPGRVAKAACNHVTEEKAVSSSEVSAKAPWKPKSIYCCKAGTSEMYLAKLSTGKEACIRLASHTFEWGNVLCELPGGKVYISGGGYLPNTTDRIVRVDTARDFSVQHMPKMQTARRCHGAEYFGGYLYIIGGFYMGYLSNCERFDCEQEQWEILQPLPHACSYMSVVALDALQCLYSLGGSNNERDYELIQRLCLKTLRWDVMQMKLPSYDDCIVCFKVDESQIYFICNSKIHSFNPATSIIKYIKTLPYNIFCFYGQCYYSTDTLYCSSYVGEPVKLVIGGLNR